MIYTLENETLKLSVNSLGAEMYALEHKPDGAQLLWNGDKAVWPRRAPILFPYAGKIKDGKVQAAGAVIGAVMKAMKGQADAARVRELVLERAAAVEE